MFSCGFCEISKKNFFKKTPTGNCFWIYCYDNLMSIPFKQLFWLLLGKYQFSQRHSSLQKLPTRVFLWKKCSRNMQQIYRRTSIPEGDFNKATEYMYYRVGHVQININCKKFIIVIWKKKKKKSAFTLHNFLQNNQCS